MTAPVDVTSLRIRQAARAVLLAPGPSVLLVRFDFPAGARWALPGGGIAPGETAEECLRRELREEVGLRELEVGPHVWSRLHVIAFLDGLHDGQRDQIHLVRLEARFDPQPEFTWEQLRAEHVGDLRWWTLAEIEESDEVFVPAALGGHLRALVEHGAPAEPVDVGI